MNTEGFNIPEEYKPLGAWKYFALQLLFAVPVVGLVFLIIFACGGTRNYNLRSYARSYFCGALVYGGIAIIILIIVAASGAMLGGMLGNM